ncbi:MAG: hypothetical protein HRU41_32680 [Saprospiraceae bacterium]|nr:hypothetical protein [Saprospiraceae bacterium]
MIKQDLPQEGDPPLHTHGCDPFFRPTNIWLWVFPFFFLNYFLASCHEQAQAFIPARHSAISVKAYEDFRVKLLDAYEAENYYLVAFNLANLRSDTGLIYENLTKAILELGKNISIE